MRPIIKTAICLFVVSAIDDVNSRVSTLRLLVALLPPVNRDTLWYLLTFLGCVSKHCDDQLDDSGQTVSQSLLSPHVVEDDRRNTTKTTVSRTSYRSTRVSQRRQLRTGGFRWSEVYAML